ncbi:arylsulfatase [Bacteroidota bacterium]
MALRNPHYPLPVTWPLPKNVHWTISSSSVHLNVASNVVRKTLRNIGESSTLVISILLLSLIGCTNKESQKINILFLMDDQHRGDCIGADGADWIQTPNLDKLAAEGAIFTRAYSSTPSCLPARTALLIGKSPWAHGVLLYAPMAESYLNEKPRIFTDAGYRTHAVGKNHFNSHPHGYQTIVLEEAWRTPHDSTFKCDFRTWFEENHPDKDVDATGLGYTDHRGNRPFLYDDNLHPTNWTADKAIEFLGTYKGEQPWFLKVSFKRPHPPFDPPERLLKHYLEQDLPLAQVSSWASEEFGEFKGSVEDTPNAPRGHYSTIDIHNARAAYYASITHVDEQIGRIIEALRQRGELENTLILFTSDHGDMMGDQHMWRKTYAYEGSSRIPMIIRWPEVLFDDKNIKRGQSIKNPVELRDVLPTFLGAAGLQKPQEMDGMNMLELIQGDKSAWRKILDLEHGTCYWKENAWVCLTDGTYKYIYFTITGEQQLFDLGNDPHELIDLAEDPANSALVNTWRDHMIMHLSVRGEPWVKDGDLAIQESSIIYGPNHPVE